MVINKRKNGLLQNRLPHWGWALVFLSTLVAARLFVQLAVHDNLHFVTQREQPQIPQTRSAGVKLDVAFVFDTTGSMGDELAQLQSNVLSIADEIAQWGNNIDIQYGLVAYKDQNDTYVKQVYPFTNSAIQFQTNLKALSASGGGDSPEDLASGLEATLHQLQWRGGVDTIQLVFVVTDASAKLYGGFTYMDSIKEAAQRGIKIHSLAASGLDDTGEYMLRQASQITMGRFIFLTYDGTAPTPGSDRTDLEVGEAKDETGVGEYTVELLPQLVLRLIREEVEATSLIRR